MWQKPQAGETKSGGKPHVFGEGVQVFLSLVSVKELRTRVKRPRKIESRGRKEDNKKNDTNTILTRSVQ